MGEAVEGVGGVFFRARDPVALRAWYAEHLGIDMEPYGTTFTSKDGDQTVWAPFPADTAYFGPGGQLMVHFRVRDLDAMLALQGAPCDRKPAAPRSLGADFVRGYER